MSHSEQDLRSLRLAAKAGDHKAARALLKLYKWGRVALEISKGRPFTRRVQTAVNALTAGIGTSWEWQDEQGNWHNDLEWPPPSRRKSDA